MINGEEVKTLIDSGAATNIITNRLRKRLGVRMKRPSKTIFTMANGKRIPSLGETEIENESSESEREESGDETEESEYEDIEDESEIYSMNAAACLAELNEEHE